MSREAIREKYLPCLLDNMRDSNHNIKLRIIGMLVHLLTKSPDHQSRARIHHFLNEELAGSKTIYDRKMYFIFCSKICPKISKKYFKDVFAWNLLRVCDDKKKDIAILFAKNVVQIRKKLDDISSISKIENYLMSFKNLFHKDAYIQQICQKALNQITTAQFKQSLKTNVEIQIEKQLQMDEHDMREREKFLNDQDKKREKELRESFHLQRRNDLNPLALFSGMPGAEAFVTLDGLTTPNHIQLAGQPQYY